MKRKETLIVNEISFLIWSLNRFVLKRASQGWKLENKYVTFRSNIKWKTYLTPSVT